MDITPSLPIPTVPVNPPPPPPTSADRMAFADYLTEAAASLTDMSYRQPTLLAQTAMVNVLSAQYSNLYRYNDIIDDDDDGTERVAPIGDTDGLRGA
ncbi:hypothetical protein FACS1894202_09000 [Clostridia bacterium]|nr:hypothetical protein FACS1894202_09000 [Clostridia bacterium]